MTTLQRDRRSKTKAIRKTRDVFYPKKKRINKWDDEQVDYKQSLKQFQQQPDLVERSLNPISTRDNQMVFPNLFNTSIPKDSTYGSTTFEDTNRLMNVLSLVRKRTRYRFPAQPVIRLTIDYHEPTHWVKFVGATRERSLPNWILEKRPWIRIVVKWVNPPKHDPNDNARHANVAWINYRSKTIELFEPVGTKSGCVKQNRHRADRMEHVRAWLQSRRCLKEFSVVIAEMPVYVNKAVGPQWLSEDNNCGIYCVLFVHLKLLNPKRSTHDIWFSFLNEFIHRYPIRWRSKLRAYIQRYKFWSRCIEPHRIRPFLK